MSCQTTFAFVLSLGDAIPDEIRSFVVEVKTIVIEFESLAASWARQILRQGFVAEMARVDQSVRAGLPIQVDKFIRAAEVVQKYSGVGGPSSIIAGKSFDNPTEVRSVVLDFTQMLALQESELVDLFPKGKEMLSNASSDLSDQLSNMMGTITQSKNELKDILAKYEPIVTAANGDLNFKDHKALLDESADGSVVKADIGKIITGDQLGLFHKMHDNECMSCNSARTSK